MQNIQHGRCTVKNNFRSDIFGQVPNTDQPIRKTDLFLCIFRNNDDITFHRRHRLHRTISQGSRSTFTEHLLCQFPQESIGNILLGTQADNNIRDLMFFGHISNSVDNIQVIT